MTHTFIFVLLAFLGVSNAEPPTYSLLGNAAHGYLQVSEDYPIGTTLFSIYAHDNDFGDVLNLRNGDSQTGSNVSITSNSTGNNVTFDVILTSPLDRELASSMKLNFFLEDMQTNMIQISLMLYITDVNDNRPVFSRSMYVWTISERPCNIPSLVGGVKAMDADNGRNSQLTYSMMLRSNGPQMDGYFEIHPVSGTVRLLKCLDFESVTEYSFIVTAKDGGPNGGLSSSVDISIQVLDVPDTPPLFIMAPKRVDVFENAPMGSILTRFDAIDGDLRINASIRYTVTYSECGPGLFNINPVDGTLRTSMILDAESNDVKQSSGVCKLTITASEILSPNVTNYGSSNVSTDMYVFVSDVNDNSPVFSFSTYKGTIPKFTSVNTYLILQESIHVHDNDQDENAKIALKLLWLNGSLCDEFLIVPNVIRWSGNVQILVKDPTVTADSKNNTLNLVISARDSGIPMRESQAMIEVNIVDNASYNMSLCPTCSPPVQCPNVTSLPITDTASKTVACSTISQHDLRFVRDRLLMMRREIDMFLQLLEED